MPLDPMTAFGLAGNLFQCVDFTWNLLVEAKQIYDSSSGISLKYEELEDVAKKFSEISTKIHQVDPSASQQEDGIVEAAASCKAVADELIDTLQALKPRNGRRIFKSFGAALESVWKKSKIESIKAKLDDRRRVLLLQYVAAIRYDIHSLYKHEGPVLTTTL